MGVLIASCTANLNLHEISYWQTRTTAQTHCARNNHINLNPRYKNSPPAGAAVNKTLPKEEQTREGSPMNSCPLGLSIGFQRVSRSLVQCRVGPLGQQTKKALSYLNRILAATAAPTLGSSVWYAHTRGLRTPRQCAVRGQAGGWCGPGWLALAVGVARPLPWWAAAGSRAGCLRGPAPVRPALLAACIGKDVSRGL